MDLIAHRGFAAVNPENTISAVRRAAGHADMIEVDVRRCGSGDLVVIHDETVDRVTNASGAVSTFDATELAALDVLGSGEGVPTLAAVLDVVPPDVGLNLELKEPDLASDVLAAVAGSGMEVLISSFLHDALAVCRDLAPDVPRATLFGENPTSSLDRAKALECVAVHPERQLAQSVVEPAHEAGLRVNVWTLERPGEGAAFDALGIDGVIADRPEVIQAGG